MKILKFSGMVILGVAYLVMPMAEASEEFWPSPAAFERLADAIYRAEGGLKASRPYGVFFPGCSWADPAYCRRICLNTLRNSWKRWEAAGRPGEFLSFLRDRYAPLSASPINSTWLNNTRAIYEQNV